MKFRIIAPIILLIALGVLYAVTHGSADTQPSPQLDQQNNTQGIHF